MSAFKKLVRWKKKPIGQNETYRRKSEINELPLEILDMILEKSYLDYTILSPNIQKEMKLSSTGFFRNIIKRNKAAKIIGTLRDRDIIEYLASVHSFWFLRMRRRKFKKTIVRHLRVLYKTDQRRVSTIRNNRNYLLLNILPDQQFIEELRLRNCLTDEQADYLIELPSDRNRNFEILRALNFRDERIFNSFQRSLSFTRQYAVARVVSEEGVVAEIKLVNEKTPYLKLYEQKLVANINRSCPTVSSTPRIVQEILDSLESKDLEILKGHQTRKGIALFMWCKSQEALNWIQAAEKSGELLEKLTRLFKQFDADITPIHIRSIEFPVKKLGVESTVYEDKVIIIGLHDGDRTTDEVLKINLCRSSEMHFIEEVPTSTDVEATAAVYRNTVYVLGFGKCWDEIWEYDFNLGWRKCLTLIQSRRRHSAAFVDEVLYICGGYIEADRRILDSVEAYNAVRNICKSVGNLVYPVMSSGNCVRYKKSLYIFGGLDKNGEESADVQVYNTIQNSCHLLSTPMPRASSLLRAALWTEKVILFGRWECFIYDFETEAWQVREQFRTNVDYFGLALSNGRIYVIGGGTSETDPNGKGTWTCRDDVRSVAIEKIVEDKPVKWKAHVVLPRPCLVHSFVKCSEKRNSDCSTTNICGNVLGNSITSQNSKRFRKTRNEVYADHAIIVGLDNDVEYITNEVLKINLYRPSEIHYVQDVPTTMKKEMAAAVYLNTLYVVGLGKNADEIWKYELNSGWSKCASLVQPRRRHSVAFVDEVLYICGGFVDADKSVLDSVEAYNTVTNTCKSVGKLVHPCYSLGNCVQYKKSLYIFGGSDEEGELSCHVQVYDTIQNSCCLLSKPMPRASMMMRAALWRETVLLLGRWNCFTYDFETEKFQMRRQFKTNVSYFGLFLWNNRIYVIGGGIDEDVAEGKWRWICRDDVRSVAIEKIIENKPVEWKVHAKLPKPCLMYLSTGIILDTCEGDNLISDDRRELPQSLDSSDYSSRLTRTVNTDEAEPKVYKVEALVIGLRDGLNTTNDVLKIDLHRPSEMHYIEQTPTQANKEMAATVHQNNVYVVGLGTHADEIWKYECNSGWSMCAFLNQRRRRHSVAFVDEVLYICGGFMDRVNGILDSVEAYSAVTNRSTSVGKLVNPCMSSGNCVAYKRSLYIFGGLDVMEMSTSDVQVYDTITNTCHLLSKPMPRASHLMRAALLRRKVILLGRCYCFIYDFVTETWEMRDQFKTNVGHFDLALSNYRVCVIGGGVYKTDEGGTVSLIFRDDVRSVAIEKIIENKPAEWRIHGRLPKPCSVHALASNKSVRHYDTPYSMIIYIRSLEAVEPDVKRNKSGNKQSDVYSKKETTKSSVNGKALKQKNAVARSKLPQEIALVDEQYFEKVVPQMSLATNHLNSVDDFISNECLDDLKLLEDPSSFGSFAKGSKISNELASLGVAELFQKIWTKYFEMDFLSNDNELIGGIMTGILNVMWNSSDSSDVLCERMYKIGLYGQILSFLGSNYLDPGKTSQLNFEKTVRGLMGILHNMVQKVSESRTALRKMKAANILQRFRSSPNEKVACVALIIQGYVISEEEKEVVNSDYKTFQFIKEMLEDALKYPDHVSANSVYFSVIEVLNALNLLAVNDDNQLRIVRAGFLPLYVKVLQHQFSSAEEAAAAEGIRIFQIRCKREVENEPGCIQALQHLVDTSSDEIVVIQAKDALRMLEKSRDDSHAAQETSNSGIIDQEQDSTDGVKDKN